MALDQDQCSMARHSLVFSPSTFGQLVGIQSILLSTSNKSTLLQGSQSGETFHSAMSANEDLSPTKGSTQNY